MSTSANVTYYQVFKNGVFVEEHSQHALCKSKIHEKLAKYSPVEDYTVVIRWPDENEVDHLQDPIPLSKFLRGERSGWESAEESVVEPRQSWDEYFMDMCRFVARRSKDSTKVGAVAVGPDKEVRMACYNGFPRGVRDDVPERNERPEKYLWTAHAEENVVSNAARVGVVLKGCVMYVASVAESGSHPPCTTCARLMIQAGVVEVVYEDGEVSEKWKANCEKALEMLEEAGVRLRTIKKEAK